MLYKQPIEEHPRWNGGKVERFGYILLRKPEYKNSPASGYIREHRFVIENKIGKPLKSTEVIHHIDGNKKNNNPSNLKIMSRRTHALIHKKGKMYEAQNKSI